ncbi:unnamed protein product [Cylicocyclus nassatus]|uniref:Uncharacterized protein n=1 Tax=Cylicocyclus nassatus TaxID=53992 RepID=A0AA36M9D7_CYLNA|nr:unnamed protein product [Cylicocyclus nassatus]
MRELKDYAARRLMVMAPGLFVQAVRVTNRLAEAIGHNYEQMEAEKGAETERKKAIIEDELKAQVAATMHKQVTSYSAEETDFQLQPIHITFNFCKVISQSSEKAKADTEFYRAQREAEANQLLLTP